MMHLSDLNAFHGCMKSAKKTLNDGKDLQILAKGDQSRLVSLETKVREMGEEVRNHMKIIVQSVK